ncbi:hypothetical protein IQ251_05955 [Saccharopolyspora sp. HNM0983]|uniref:Uncharacterized protein n=1 Tax=Saccharopolyspora montiporae TaxID=2781240 RepID=A0A929FZQ4_9PSEU|nr:hypothetical protein [Saccharopolyspora sp. HNM0983]MBE9373987.1 hypothetical protein [Saccharopolyspora sp. HNM0983]
MGHDTELELLITVVVGAEDEHSAHTACQALVQRVGGRIVDSADCSDEEPGCWAVTISSPCAETGEHIAGLSRAVRNFMRGLGPDYARHRVACEPPTAWTVVDHPDLLDELVGGCERLMVEAWTAAELPGPGPVEPPEPAATAEDRPDAALPRLHLTVDVAAQRRAGAEWQARALVGRIARGAGCTSCEQHDDLWRVAFDLSPAEWNSGNSASWSPADREPAGAAVLRGAADRLGGSGWRHDRASASWTADRHLASGVAAIRLSVENPAETGDPEPR